MNPSDISNRYSVCIAYQRYTFPIPTLYKPHKNPIQPSPWGGELGTLCCTDIQKPGGTAHFERLEAPNLRNHNRSMSTIGG